MAPREKIFVPWVDDNEWEAVRNQISSSNIKDVIRGYETILLWKLRHFALPAYVESTLCILQVKIKHEKLTHPNNIALSLLEEYDHRLAYSTALMRFVNHVSSIAGNKYQTLYSTAKTQNIPDWIVNIRHEAAHSHDLPTLDALYTALDRSFEWLLTNYWKKKKNVNPVKKIRKTGPLYQENQKDEINCLLRTSFLIWDGLPSNKILLKDMKSDFMSHTQEFFNLKDLYFSHVELNREKYIRNFIWSLKEAESSVNDMNVKELTVGALKSMLLDFFQVVVKKETFKMSFLSALLASSFITGNSTISKWKKVFDIVQNGKLLEELMRNLFLMAGDGNEKASKWLSILLASIKVLKKKWTMFKALKKETSKKDYNKIKQRLNMAHSTPNKKPAITFNVSKPPLITLDMISPVLINPETHHLKDLIKYLKLVKPPLPQTTIALIQDLLHIGELPQIPLPEGTQTPDTDDNIFTLQDLQSAAENNLSDSLADLDSQEPGWRKTEIDSHRWSKYPLGLLPFQSKVNCTLPEDLNWTVEVVRPDKTTLRKSINSFTETLQVDLS